MEALNPTTAPMSASELLSIAIAQGSSDLHLNPGYPPMIRVNGAIMPLTGSGVYQHADIARCIAEVTTAEQRKHLEADHSVDFTWGMDQTRFRTNVSMSRVGYQICFRIIPLHIPTAEELQLPKAIVELSGLQRGLVLVTGAAGAGKSTTLACLLNIINNTKPVNIVTVEDPIEFVYPTRRALISQREIGPHAPSFERALRDVLRQDPDVVMVGEMRDLETISSAITVAETGHLVFATLHSYDAASAVDRIVDVFPARQQQQIRIQLASVLKAVVAQTLIPSRAAGRVAAREILLVNPAVANMIRQARTHEIPSMIEMGTNQGMTTMERSIQELIRVGAIDPSYQTKAPNK